MQVAARVLVESSAEGIRMTVRAPGTEEPGQGDSMLVELMGRIAEVLAELPDDHKGLTGNAVARAVPGNTEMKRQALTALVHQDYVSRKTIGQGFYHRLVKPFIPEFDTLD